MAAFPIEGERASVVAEDLARIHRLLGGDGLSGSLPGVVVEDVVVRRTLLSGCSTVVLWSGSGWCWMVRPPGLVTGR